MTLQEIEAALGKRPVFVKAGDNRSLVKRWLHLKGIPSSVTEKATLRELADAYNDSSEKALNALAGTIETRLALKAEMERRKAEGAHIPADDEDEAQRNRDEADEAETTTPPTPVRTQGGTLESIFGSLIDERIGNVKAGLDESSVRVLIDERIQEIGVIRHDVTVRTDRGELKTEIKGAHKEFSKLLRIMASRMPNGLHPNIMISGPTGSGKTHAVEQAAKALGLEFYSNGAVSQDYQLIGFKDGHGNYHETPLRRALGRPAVYLFDEFDSSDNSPMLCIAAVMANSGFWFPDEYVTRHPDSILVANGNTWGNGATADFCGRVKIDGAIRSRFPVRLAWDYDEALEIAMCGNAPWAAQVQKARALARKAGLKVIIDPRMTQAGAGLIADGFSFEEAASLTYLADLNPDQRKMLSVD